jgi:hypothetical protein
MSDLLSDVKGFPLEPSICKIIAGYLLRIPPAPAVQTLARIGKAEATGISADAAGNVYLEAGLMGSLSIL